jgi:hypothetical protein
MSTTIRPRHLAELHITDALHNGRLLQRHLDALDLYGPTAVQLEDPDHLAVALAAIDQALEQVQSLTRDLNDAREVIDAIAREVTHD